uniref:Glycosyl transferase CAP10 domain-containing protein n=1 Tax=Psilocybe cubensis TaxID=181762 RepID=A0A8H7XUJ7_PSICU
MSLTRTRKALKLSLFLVAAVLFVFIAFQNIAPFPIRAENVRLQRIPPQILAANSTQQLPFESPKPPLGKHLYRPDGLLEVNNDGAHPIYELMSRAEAEWVAKHERASKTLEDAVSEYRRRYKRAPPKGFDLWWKFAVEHNVQLPDEYDQIFIDLEAFWGIEPKDLIEIRKEIESKKGTYTIGKNETSQVEIVAHTFEEDQYPKLVNGTKDLMGLFRLFEDDLPPFRITMSPQDRPNLLSDYSIKAATLEAAASQTYIQRRALPKVKTVGWIAACPPNSLARQKTINLDSPPPRPSKKTFIWDHLQTMDPCNHPNHFYHHGQFLSHNMGPSPQSAMVPEFSYSSSMIHHDIRFPAPYGWLEDIYPLTNNPEWDDRKDERLLWRGANTGIFHGKNTRWEQSHRDFLVSYTNSLEGTVNVLPSNRTREERLGDLRELRAARINPAVMDVAFAGTPISCSPEICEVLKKTFPWRNKQSIQEAGNYKYVIDVDGNGWSGRFKKLMTTNSLVFKSTIYPEWFADRVAPWVHYVPIQIDLSDLHDALIFFRGDGNGDGAHEDLARKIAIAGRQWSKTYWRKEDLAAYFYRLCLEYIRLMSADRKLMSYKDAA